MNKLMLLLPDYYPEIYEMKKLTEAEERELQGVEQAVQQLLNNQFVMTSDEPSIRRRERMLRIQANPSSETLDFRKKRLINRYSTKPPFTLRYLQERLDFLVGEGRAIASVDIMNFMLTVTTSIEDASLFKEVQRSVAVMIPANLVYQHRTSVNNKIIMNERIVSRTLDRKTRLSTGWRLGIAPFAEIGPEVIIK